MGKLKVNEIVARNNPVLYTDRQEEWLNIPSKEVEGQFESLFFLDLQSRYTRETGMFQIVHKEKWDLDMYFTVAEKIEVPHDRKFGFIAVVPISQYEELCAEIKNVSKIQEVMVDRFPEQTIFNLFLTFLWQGAVPVFLATLLAFAYLFSGIENNWLIAALSSAVVASATTIFYVKGTFDGASAGQWEMLHYRDRRTGEWVVRDNVIVAPESELD